MVRRRAKKTRRRSKSVSILNTLEAYSYAHILSSGIAGTSPWGLLTGKTDLAGVQTPIYNDGIMNNFEYVGSGEISLGDIIKEPGVALNVMATNFQSNMVAMAMQSAVTAFGFRFGRRLLRRPLSSVQRNIVKPLLGAGVRI